MTNVYKCKWRSLLTAISFAKALIILDKNVRGEK